VSEAEVRYTAYVIFQLDVYCFWMHVRGSCWICIVLMGHCDRALRYWKYQRTIVVIENCL
jgi:hypothetical protein